MSGSAQPWRDRTIALALPSPDGSIALRPMRASLLRHHDSLAHLPTRLNRPHRKGGILSHFRIEVRIALEDDLENAIRVALSADLEMNVRRDLGVWIAAGPDRVEAPRAFRV